MEQVLSKDKCSGCHACYSVCPRNAITMKMDKEGFLYPQIDQNKCINCFLCRGACPVLSMDNVENELPKKICYAACAKNHEERRTSSSGGVFSAIARQIINEDGFVCGALFDEHLTLQHEVIQTETNLMRLKGSKYIQSKIGDSFIIIKEILSSGRKVLFCGTPCQVAGLKSFLKSDPDNLFTVDLICHGVPSPGVFNKYLQEKTQKRVIDVRFREKTVNEQDTEFCISLEDGMISKERTRDNLFYQGFIKNYYLRPSCYDCGFKGIHRSSDITIGDFWGVQEYHPQFSDKAGTSSIIVNTSKGKKVFEIIKDKLHCESAKLDEITQWNTCYYQSVACTHARSDFFDLIETSSIEDTVRILMMKEKKEEKHHPLKSLEKYIQSIVNGFLQR